MTNELVHKDIDAEETDDVLQRRGKRRTRLMAAAGATALIAGGGLLIARPWSSDETGSPSSTSVAGQGAVDDSEDPVVAFSELPYVLLDDLPDGWVVQWASDAPFEEGGMGEGTEQTVTLLRGEGASFSDGPWVGVSVQLLDRFDRQTFNPQDYFGGADGGSTPVRVGAYDGVLVEGWWGPGTTLVFGPVNDGFVVTVEAVGVEEADLLRLAAEITLVEDGVLATPVFGTVPGELALAPFLEYRAEVFGIGGGGVSNLGFGNRSINAGWGEAGGEDSMNLTITTAPAGVDFNEFAHFYIGDAEDVEVGEWSGVAGTQDNAFSSGSMVAWEVDGAAVLLTSSLDLDELVEVAASARRADDDEWAALVAEANDWQGDADGTPGESWVIGAGDASNSTTWLLEGSVDEEGRLTTCVSAMGDMWSNTGFCGNAAEIQLPSVEIVQEFAGEVGGALVLALGGPELVGATLQFTDADGVQRTTALAVVREDWPFVAAAMHTETAGTFRLLAADGSVLATLEVTEDDLSSGGIGVGVGGAATETTAVASNG